MLANPVKELPGEVKGWADRWCLQSCVLLINQYIFVFFFPTPFLEGTLNVGDRSLVSKTIYG